jgi:hypothetical protein
VPARIYFIGEWKCLSVSGMGRSVAPVSHTCCCCCHHPSITAQPGSRPAAASFLTRPVALYVRRYVWADGLNFLVPTAHSLLLCFMMGPLGLLSHMLTKAAIATSRKQSRA